jgi:hypothetical protein
MLTKKSVTGAVSLLVLTGCSSVLPPSGPWPRTYQVKFSDNISMCSNGQGLVVYIAPVKNAQPPASGTTPTQHTVYDLKNHFQYEWVEGTQGFTKKELKEDEGPAWYYSKKGIEAMESNARINKLGDKKIQDINCKGFAIFQRDPIAGTRVHLGENIPSVTIRHGLDITQELWISPEYELVMSRGIHGNISGGTDNAISNMTSAISFTGNGPDPSVFGPAVNETAGGMVNVTAANSAILSNMQAVKSLVDMYAGGHQGNYPNTVQELNSALAQGHATGLLNPVTGKHEFPQAGGVADIKAARDSQPKTMAPGSIEYNVLPGGRSYAIIGGDGSGKALSGEKEKTTMVLSNI